VHAQNVDGDDPNRPKPPHQEPGAGMEKDGPAA
jgi:hypothetical protein